MGTYLGKHGRAYQLLDGGGGGGEAHERMNYKGRRYFVACTWVAWCLAMYWPDRESYDQMFG